MATGRIIGNLGDVTLIAMTDSPSVVARCEKELAAMTRLRDAAVAHRKAKEAYATIYRNRDREKFADAELLCASASEEFEASVDDFVADVQCSHK